MVFGTFDVFHEGHKNFFKQAKKYGDFLIVVIARDRTVRKVKGRRPRNDENKRLKLVLTSGLAGKAVLGSLRDKYAAIRKYGPEVICLGYDQAESVERLGARLAAAGFKKIRIYRLKPYKPEIYKSSRLK